MQTIYLHHPYQKNEIPEEEVALALGFFDGVHKGHRVVINAARKEADKRGIKLAVMTFNQHPSIVFQKINPDDMEYLSTEEQKINMMAELDVDYLYIIEFTSAFASLSPQDFVDQYVVDLHAQVVVAGFDYTYGKKNIANMECLPVYAQKRFDIITIGKQSLDGHKVSSTRIREELAHGEMEEVKQLLGYTYITPGLVVHGDARGRTLGYPTANIQIPHEVRLPRPGIYAVKLKVSDKWYLGMASFGRNVTFGSGRPLTVEVYILDFHADIYGEQVEVKWYHHLRSEIKFDGVDPLIEQLNQDKEDTANYFVKMRNEKK